MSDILCMCCDNQKTEEDKVLISHPSGDFYVDGLVCPICKTTYATTEMMQIALRRYREKADE